MLVCYQRQKKHRTGERGPVVVFFFSFLRIYVLLFVDWIDLPVC